MSQLDIDTRSRSPREVWHSLTEEVSRGDLLALISVAVRNPLRTWQEQQALIGAIEKLDYPAISDMGPVKEQATSQWSRAHRCDCGTVSAGYWCSEECQLDQGGLYSDEEDEA